MNSVLILLSCILVGLTVANPVDRPVSQKTQKCIRESVEFLKMAQLDASMQRIVDAVHKATLRFDAISGFTFPVDNKEYYDIISQAGEQKSCPRILAIFTQFMGPVKPQCFAEAERGEQEQIVNALTKVKEANDVLMAGTICNTLSAFKPPVSAEIKECIRLSDNFLQTAQLDASIRGIVKAVRDLSLGFTAITGFTFPVDNKEYYRILSQAGEQESCPGILKVYRQFLSPEKPQCFAEAGREEQGQIVEALTKKKEADEVLMAGTICSTLAAFKGQD